MSKLHYTQDGAGDEPAFPVTSAADHQFCGMSLRDYFATEAMHAELMTCGVPGEAAAAMVDAMQPDETVELHIARTAYRMADAMLAARKEGGAQ